MAVSKKAPGSVGAKPDAAAFVRLIDDGSAPPHVVSEAYQQALREWQKTTTDREWLRAAMADGGVVQHRVLPPADATPTAEARLIKLNRIATFKGNPQEEQ